MKNMRLLITHCLGFGIIFSLSMIPIENWCQDEIESDCNEELLPNTVIDDDISIASIHTSAILKPVNRLVELWRDPRGFLMPKYRPRLMKHMCKMLAEQAKTSHVTYMLHHVIPKGQNPRKKRSNVIYGDLSDDTSKSEADGNRFGKQRDNQQKVFPLPSFLPFRSLSELFQL